MSNELGFFERIRIQLEVLLPILNRLRAQYGKSEIDKLVIDEIDKYLKMKYTDKANLIEGSDKDKWQTLNTELLESVNGDIELEIADMNDRKVSLFANSCKIAEYFNSINETELGYHLACKVDNHIAEICAKEVEFKRDNTLMVEGKRCDYVYNFVK